MGLQFQSSTCRCLKAAAREVRNTELTQEVRLRDGMPDIGRVLTSWGQVVLRSKEWQGNLITVAGGIMVWILYAPEDGTPPRCVDTWVPFQLKWELESAGGDGPIRVYPLLRFVDSRGIAARKIMVRTGVAAMGEAFTSMQAEIYRPEEIPEDVQLLKNTYPIRLAIEAGEKTFLLDEEVQLSGVSAKPERLLAYTVWPQIQEKRVTGDKTIMRGTAKLHIIYRCEDGKVHTADTEVPFSQLIQLEQSYGPDAQADYLIGTTSLELLESDGEQLRIKCGMVAQYLITDRFLAEIIEDAYSPKRSVEPDMETLGLPSMLEQRTELLQAEQKIPGMDGNVVDVTFLPDFPRRGREKDRMALEIPGQFQILYYAQDGSLQGSTVRWEKHMEIMADEESCISYLPQPYGTVQTVAGVDELGLSAQLKLEMQTHKNTSIPMITGLELGQEEATDEDRPSLILCRMEDQSIWNIAKECGSTVEQIERMNHLNGQPAAGQMLMIPVI